MTVKVLARLPLLAAILTICVASGEEGPAPVDATEADAQIFERQQIMQQLDKDAEQLGLIVAGLEPRDQLGPTARAVARGAAEAEASFQQIIPGGRSKPEVWSNHEDFARRMADFTRRAEAMAVLAEADDMNGVTETLGEAMPCKACHDIYRTPRRADPAAAQ